MSRLTAPSSRLHKLFFWPREVRHLLIILVTGVVMLRLAWVGYVGSDDHSYARGALGWLTEFPYVGTDHWTLRQPVVVPIAVSLAVFGLREISLGIPSALLFLVLLGTTYHYLRRVSGSGLALGVALCLATVPLLAVQATFPQDVIVETLAVSLSFWLFYGATTRERPGLRMVAAGAMAALGWLTRETTAGLLAFYGILFLIGFGVRRRYYWFMALGFTLLVGLEVAYFGALTGDPFYRYRIDLWHDRVDRGALVGLAATSGSRLNMEGNLAVPAYVEPIVALLLNQEFGLLFWFFVPAAVWASAGRGVATEERRLLRVLTGLALVWMVFVSVNASVLYVVPRYYAVSTWAAVIIVVYWLRRSLFAWQPKAALVAGSVLVAANLLGLYVENKQPLFAERALVNYVVEHRIVVYTDPMTRTRAKLLLEFRNASDLVRSDSAPPGALFYANRSSIERCRRIVSGCSWAWEDYLPKPHWTEITRIEGGRKWSGILASLVGLDKLIPTEIFKRLDRPNPGGVFYLTASAVTQSPAGDRRPTGLSRAEQSGIR